MYFEEFEIIFLVLCTTRSSKGVLYVISWRLLSSACLDYLTLICNVNVLLTAVLLRFVVVFIVVVLFSFVTGSYFAYFNCSFTVVVTCTCTQ